MAARLTALSPMKAEATLFVSPAAPPGCAPGGAWGTEEFVGFNALVAFVILLFVFLPVSPLVFLCSWDSRVVYVDPAGRKFTASGMPIPDRLHCCGKPWMGPTH